MANERYDGVWRPEHGKLGWIPTRYVVEDGRRRRYEDGRWFNGDFYPRPLDTLSQCDDRCAVLNAKA